MKFEWIETEFDGIQLIKIEDSGKVWNVPENPSNRYYAEYLRYTAWVEAGNDPEEFWTQGSEI